MQKVTYKGKTYRSVTVACDFLGINPSTVFRLYKNIPFEQAVEQILKNKRRNSCTDHLGNTFGSIKSMALAYWLPPTTLYARLNRKWNLEQALTTPDGKPRGKYANKIQGQKI